MKMSSLIGTVALRLNPDFPSAQRPQLKDGVDRPRQLERFSGIPQATAPQALGTHLGASVPWSSRWRAPAQPGGEPATWWASSYRGQVVVQMGVRQGSAG